MIVSRPWYHSGLCVVMFGTCGLGLSGVVAGRAEPSATKDGEPVAKTSPTRLRAALELAEKKVKSPLAPATVKQAGKVHVVLNVEFQKPADAQFNHPDASLISRYDRFMDVLVEATKLKAIRNDLAKAPGLLWYDVGEEVVAPPRPVPMPGKLLDTPGLEKTARGGEGQLKNRTGKGVIIAVIDSGVDFRNPAFISTAEGRKESRFAYFWDTTAPAKPKGEQPPVKYPDGTRIGAIYTRTELTAALPKGGNVLQDPDELGHGTACAGIAAGNNGESPLAAGVAPDADLIAVRIGGAGSTLPNAFLLNSIIEWVHEKAGAQSAVVSCSFGGQMFGRDGHAVAERRLDELGV